MDARIEGSMFTKRKTKRCVCPRRPLKQAAAGRHVCHAPTKQPWPLKRRRQTGGRTDGRADRLTHNRQTHTYTHTHTLHMYLYLQDGVSYVYNRMHYV